MSVAAYYKGTHSFLDPYPGYGERARAVRLLRDDIADWHEELAGQIEDRFEDAEGALDKAVKARTQAITKYNKAVDGCHQAWRILEREVRSAESQLRVHIAQIAGQYRAVRRCKSSKTEEAIPEHLVSFRGYLDVAMPPYAPPPEVGTCKARLAVAKADALKTLSALFQHAYEPPHEETPQ
jgi:hypothetical protein